MTPSDYILLCEGEPDTLCALSRGLEAVCQTGGAGTWKDEFNAFFQGKKVAVCYDADDPGRAGAQKAARAIAAEAAEVRVISWPEFMAKGQDLTDWFMTHGKTVDDLMALVAGAEVVRLPKAPASPAGPARQEVDPTSPYRFWHVGENGRPQFREAWLAGEILDDMSPLTDRENRHDLHLRGRVLASGGFQGIESPGSAQTGGPGQDGPRQPRGRAGGGTLFAPVRRIHEPQAGAALPGKRHARPGFLAGAVPRPGAPRHLALSVSFDPESPIDCPRWKHFLRQVIGHKA